MVVVRGTWPGERRIFEGGMVREENLQVRTDMSRKLRRVLEAYNRTAVDDSAAMHGTACDHGSELSTKQNNPVSTIARIYYGLS
jgi:hypothetical protein